MATDRGFFGGIDARKDSNHPGRAIHEDVAKDLLKHGLIEGDAPHYIISLGIAKNTH